MSQPAAFLTRWQAELLMNALYADAPRSPTALGGGTSGGDRRGRVSALVRAGLIEPHGSLKRPRYALTPAGRVFAEALQRLEMAREAD